MQTAGGIELNLKESSYYIDLFGLRFFFSSEFYKEKFRKNVKEYVNLEAMKICNRYKIPIVLNRYLAISYYKRLEKRGFRILEINTDEEINYLFFKSEFLKG